MGEANCNVTSVVNTASAIVSFYVKQFGKVYKLAEEVFASGDHHTRPWLPLPEKTQVKLTTIAYDDNIAVRASFYILLLDKTIWDV